jgi:dTDP-glucose 4,6-dehydratase
MTDRVGPGAHLLVTGGAGFIGSELVRQVMARRDGTRITVLDKLTYAGNRANLAAVEDDPEQAARFAFVHGDIADPSVVNPLVADADAVLNVAAETHVDRSILDPEAFLRTGVIGVHVLLEAVRAEAAKERSVRFLQVSTDEVYGDIPSGHSVERDPLAPRSPYAAAKASSELLVGAYARLQHVRPAPASREADPAVHDERPGRRAAPDVRRRDAGPRLAPRVGSRRRRRLRPAAWGIRRGLQRGRCQAAAQP